MSIECWFNKTNFKLDKDLDYIPTLKIVVCDEKDFLYLNTTIIIPKSKFNVEEVIRRFCAYNIGSLHLDDLPEKGSWEALVYLLTRVRGDGLKISTISKRAKEKLQNDLEGFISTFNEFPESVRFERAWGMYFKIKSLNETEE